jgi:teichuronic acid biosynthesis protein TuaE
VSIADLAIEYPVPAAAILALALWLAWRRPAQALMFALASLAIRPELLWGGPHIGVGWGLHRILLVVALIANAIHFGLRKSINWPIVALLVIFGLNLLFGELHRELTVGFMLTSLMLLALPFAVSQVMLDPEFRRTYALVIALTPSLSVGIGVLLQLAGIHTMFANLHDRLEGATGNAGVFALLAFAGFAVALHEAVREGRLRPVALVGMNLALLILSGTRIAMLASAVLMLAYVAASEELRQRLLRNPVIVVVALLLVGAAVTPYIPKLYGRIFEGLDRSDVWQYFYGEFLRSPFVGRGIGTGFLTEIEWPDNLERPYLPVPHNEYLHLLVIGGVLGLIVCLIAIVLWYWNLLRAASPRDREFLLALGSALAVYAITDNILIYSSALGLYVYLGVICRSTDVQSSIAAADHGAGNRGAGVVTRSGVRSSSVHP